MLNEAIGNLNTNWIVDVKKVTFKGWVKQAMGLRSTFTRRSTEWRVEVCSHKTSSSLRHWQGV